MVGGSSDGAGNDPMCTLAPAKCMFEVTASADLKEL